MLSSSRGSIERKFYGHLAVLILVQNAGYDLNLGNAAIRVLNILAGYACKDGYCFPSITQIAQKLGLSRQAIRKQIKNLEESGYLTVTPDFHKNGGRKSNLYHLNIDDIEREDSRDVTSTVTPPETPNSNSPMLPVKVTEHETSKGYIKLPNKKTNLNEHTNSRFSKHTSVKRNSEAFYDQAEFEQEHGIKHNAEKKLEKLIIRYKSLTSPSNALDFDMRAREEIKGLSVSEKLNKLINIYETAITCLEELAGPIGEEECPSDAVAGFTV